MSQETDGMTMTNHENSLPIQKKQPPLAVVGLSALFPKAASIHEFWSNIRNGVDSITEVPETHWSPDEYFDGNQKTPDMTYARRGGFLSPVSFDPMEFGISPSNLEAIDTAQLLGLVAAKRALEHAGYGSNREFDRSRIGCILGVTGTLEMVIPLGARLGHPKWRKALKDAGVAADVAEDVVQRISQSYVPWQENSFPGLLGNVVAGRIANRLNLHGTNCVVDAACASSLSAIHLAALELWTGRSDMVVTGGIDTFNDIFMFMCFSKTPALSPTGDAKPFSEDADGTILGEGVGMLVLKRLVDAERDNDKILAVIKGIGTSSDGAGSAVYAPRADGQIRCLQDAYQVADVAPETIELIEAHGTGTKVGDATEIAGLMHVYKSTKRRGTWCALGSVKSQIGHTKAAAGAAGVLKAILALRHRVLPPTIKVNQPPAALSGSDSPFYVNTEARPWLKSEHHPRRAAVSAFGFGGSNFHCVLEESPQVFADPDWDGDVQVLAFSAMHLKELVEQIRLLPWSEFAVPEHTSTAENALPWSAWAALRNMAHRSRTTYQVEHQHRLLFVVERERANVEAAVAGALTLLERYPDRSSWSTPDGVYYGRGPQDGRLGVLFPGQGSQYVGMLRELACRFPVMQDVLAEANDVYSSAFNPQENSANRLTDYVYPQSAWSAEARLQRDNQLRATQIAQPAIGAISLGSLAILSQFGVCPSAAAGHSYGELTALCASRRIQPEALYRLSMLRGQLMAAAQEEVGGMLAVGAPLTQVEALIKELAVDLVVANYNSPNQVVLSGRLPEIERVTALLATRNMRGRKLQVAAAFHSPLVASASRAFRPELDHIDFAPSEMPVYANTTATEYPSDPVAARDLLACQLAKPVNFVREIEQMYSDGVRTFLEVGPSGVLSGLVNSILSGRPYRAIAIDSSHGRRSGVFDLAQALAQLSASGYSLHWSLWDPQRDDEQNTEGHNRLKIPICGANYVKPRTPMPPRPQPACAPAIPLADGHEPSLNPLSNAALKGDLAFPPRASIEFKPAEVSTIKIDHSDVDPPSDSAVTQVSLPPTQSETPVVDSTPDYGHDSRTVIQDNLRALQRMQEETAKLHQRFLEGQEAALKTFEMLASRHLQLVQVSGLEHPVSVGNQTNGPLERRSESLNPHADLANEMPHSQGVPQNTIGLAPTLMNEKSAAATAAVVPASYNPAPSMPQLSSAPKPIAKTSALASILLSVVSEKTGYPVDMLNLQMSLDHDLGIDSIKRVEILSALQDRVPNLPEFRPDELGALQTLQDVVGLAEKRTVEPRVRIEGLASTPSVAVLPSSQIRSPGSSSDSVDDVPGASLATTVLAIVSEKTGYPIEMLNLGMSLDHDLGIDSIKRVEILSALQDRVPNLPEFRPDELGALQTLQDVVGLAEKRQFSVIALPSEEVVFLTQQPQGSSLASSHLPLARPVYSTFDSMTRSIVRPISLPASDSRPLLPLARGAEIWITEDGLELSLSIAKELSGLGFQPRVVNLDEPFESSVSGLLVGLIIIAPAGGIGDRQLWRALEWLQRVGPCLRHATAAGAAVLATVSKMDGRFGFEATASLADPNSGGLSGLLKSASREWPELTCKAFDISRGWKSASDAAHALVHEFLRVGPIEIGLSPQGVCALSVIEEGLATPSDTAAPVLPCELFIVSGGARGVTAEVAIAIAKAWRPRIVILGRSSLPTDEPEWLAPLLTENVIRQTLISRAPAGTLPRSIELQLRQILAEREVAVSLSLLRATGAQIVYRSVDVRDQAVLRALISNLQREFGPVRGLIHGAGVLADGRIEDKTRDQFDRVFETKVSGLRNLLGSIDPDDLRVLCVFSSYTARYGRVGQSDYAMANEVLNKMSLQFAIQHPKAKVISFNWGPWNGGMVTQSLKAIFAAEGVGLIPMADGAELLVRELTQTPSRSVERMVIGKFEASSSLNSMAYQPGQATFEGQQSIPGIGLNPPLLTALQPSCVSQKDLSTSLWAGSVKTELDSETVLQETPASGVLSGFGQANVPVPDDIKPAFERILDLENHPFLESHVIDGKAVLPVSVIAEWLAHAAIHRNPGLELHGFDDLRIFQGVRVDRHNSATLSVLAGKPRRIDDLFDAKTQLIGKVNNRNVVHAAAQVILSPSYHAAPVPSLHVSAHRYAIDLATTYQTRLFHGIRFQGIMAIEACSSDGIVLESRTTSAPWEWMREPLRNTWLIDPLAIDVALQAVIIWSQEMRQEPCLPCFISRYRQYRRVFPREGVRIVVRVRQATGHTIRCDVEFIDFQGLLIARMEGCESVADASLSAAFKKNRLA